MVTDLAALDIDLSDIAAVLEREGVTSFFQSWNDLIASVERQLESAGAEVPPAGAVKPANGIGVGSSAPTAAAPAATAKGSPA